MPIKMHFSTFVKLLTLDTGDKLRHLESYAKPGGFDFYRTSREAIDRYATQGQPCDHTLRFISQRAPHNAAASNTKIFEQVTRWLDKQSGNRIAPMRGVWKSPKKTFSVLIEPEIGLEKNGTTRFLAVYPRKEPRLNRDNAGAAIVLLRSARKEDPSIQFGIFDAHGEKAFWTPTNVSSAVLTSEIATIEAALQKIIK